MLVYEDTMLCRFDKIVLRKQFEQRDNLSINQSKRNENH